MEGNDLNFFAASSASLLSTSHLLQTPSVPSVTPLYSIVDSSDPTKQESHFSSITTNNNNRINVAGKKSINGNKINKYCRHICIHILR